MDEVGIDDHCSMHAIMPSGRRVTIHRHPRRAPQIYYGASLAFWINEIVSHSPSVTGWIMLAGLQFLVHEAWPRKFPRRKKSVGDQATDKIMKVL